MAAEPDSSTRVRRIVAVFVDTIVFLAVWTVIGLVFSQNSLFYTIGLVFVVDVALTAFFGRSVGRWVTGLRVAKPDGGQPGLVSALIRTALVFVSGWVGLVLYWFSGLIGLGSRMWWDAAAGTHIVRTAQAAGMAQPSQPPADMPSN